MKDKTIDIITVILVIFMAITCAIVAKYIMQPKTQVYVQKWASPETGVCYYITDYGICPLYNADGTLYVEAP